MLDAQFRKCKVSHHPKECDEHHTQVQVWWSLCTTQELTIRHQECGSFHIYVSVEQVQKPHTVSHHKILSN